MKPAAGVAALPAPRPRREWALWCLLCLPGVLLLAPVRQAIEASMALQMLAEFPVLLALGFVASVLAARRHDGIRAVEALMRMGLAPLLCFSLCLMFWMVPLALDLARLDAGVNAAKYISLLFAGAALQHGLRRAPAAVLLFFAGNLVWTLATVGMLFHDTRSRLCANYLLADQWLAGNGLIAYAVAVAVGLVLHLRRLPGFGFSPRGGSHEGEEQ
ncbi:hypothetical protein AB4156_07805 [Cupriavidus sp. 2MCAB6]|uniref:hypothetical protein n=1 Tax=Cupriavidus sp. 2MCAB6 TaxID=3232981 RepID=UPI003F938CA3